MSTPSHLPLPQAKRAAFNLALATAIGGSMGPIAIGTGGLVGSSLLPPDEQSYATFPVTAFVLGSAICSIPAALLMQRIGRRAGFLVGAFLGAMGAGGGTVAILIHHFWLFAASMLFVGAAGAFGQQYRFAAADASEPAFKPKAISWVMAGGVVTGVLGPQVSIHARGIFPDAPFAGPFLVLVGLIGLTALILSRLDLPRPAPIVKGSNQGRPVTEIVFNPRFLTALLSAIASYALMSFVMTASPLAMIAHHHSNTDAQLAIQWHVIAMFAPSFFTGSIIARFGKPLVATAGLLIIVLSAVVALMGTDLWHFWTALILLGIGWNFGFIASTAMTAELYRPEEAFRVQAVNEFMLFGTVAAASFSSGKLLTAAGWETVNIIVFPVVGVCLLLLSARAIAERRAGMVRAET